MSTETATWSQRRRPDHLEEIELGMSNFDHSIDEGLDVALAEGPSFAQYSGWDFCGYVWCEGSAFHCEVWRHRAYVETVSADTLEAIMAEASDRYGAD